MSIYVTALDNIGKKNPVDWEDNEIKFVWDISLFGCFKRPPENLKDKYNDIIDKARKLMLVYNVYISKSNILKDMAKDWINQYSITENIESTSPKLSKEKNEI